MSHNQPRPLSALQPGEEATVLRVTAQDGIRQRLLEMGFVRGARLKVEKLAPLGDPMELNVRSYELSVRKSDAEMIEVQ